MLLKIIALIGRAKLLFCLVLNADHTVFLFIRQARVSLCVGGKNRSNSSKLRDNKLFEATLENILCNKFWMQSMEIHRWVFITIS